MPTKNTKGMPAWVRVAEDIVLKTLKALKKRGVVVKDETNIPEMTPGEKRTYDTAFGVLAKYLEISLLEKSFETIKIEDLHDLTPEEEQRVWDDPDSIVEISRRKQRERMSAESGDSSAAS